MSGGRRLITARVVQGDEPDWQPLARLASDHLMCSFMWMFEVATPRGERFHAYKHAERLAGGGGPRPNRHRACQEHRVRAQAGGGVARLPRV